jgi:hypothetical protein
VAENQENIIRKVRRKRRRRLMRWTLYLSLVVAVILLTLEGINFGRYFGDVLNETIKKSYSGKYALEFDQINYKVWKNVFVAHNFTFREFSPEDPLKTNPVYVHMDEVIFDVDNIVNILLKREFSVDGILIQNPIIRITQDDEGETSVEGREVFNNFYNLVMETVFALEIENLDVEHARLSITFTSADSESNISFGDISFRIADLKIDASTLTDDLINLAEEIEVSFYNQRFYTFDSAFQVQVDTFTLTTEKPRIEVVGLDFVDSTAQYLGNAEAEFSVSHMILEGVDLDKLYRENFLQVDSLLIDANNINLSDILIAGQNDEQDEKPKKFTKYLNQSFAGLVINTLLLQQQGLRISAENRGKMIDFVLDSLGLTIQGFRLDSTSAGKRFDIDYDDIVLKASRYARNLPDSTHQLTIKNIQVSATQKKLVVDSLKVQPIQLKNKHQALIDLQIPEIILDNANTVEFLNGDLLEVEAMKIKSPRLTIKRASATDQNQQATGLRDVLENIPFGRIEQIEVDNGNLAIKAPVGGSILSINNFQLTINDLIKDDSSTIFYYAPYGLNGVDFSTKYIGLEKGNNQWQFFDLTSKLGINTDIVCKNGRISEKVKLDSSMAFKIASEFESLYLSGIDHNKLSTGNIFLDTLMIDAIQVKGQGRVVPVNSKSEFKSKKDKWELKELSCNFIELSDIYLEVELDNLTGLGFEKSSIRLKKLKYSPTTATELNDKWNFQDIDFQVRNFQYASESQRHDFRINDIDYSFASQLLNVAGLA